jgi:hypothetical protein
LKLKDLKKNSFQPKREETFLHDVVRLYQEHFQVTELFSDGWKHKFAIQQVSLAISRS